MSEKVAYNPYNDLTELAPPSYESVAGPSGSSVMVDTQTGLCQDGSAAPPSDEEAIRAIYGGVSGISLLSESDTIILVDDSESMKTFGYWALVEQCLSYVGPVVATYDLNGITMYCLNTRGPSQDNLTDGIAGQGWNDITNAIEIKEIFKTISPMGTTPIYDRLCHILTPYLARLAKNPTNRPRPINILTLTDGEADDPEGVEELIGEICGVLDETNAPNNQIGLQFIQIGDLDFAERHIKTNAPPRDHQRLIQKAANDFESAKAWLKKLDDFLKGNNAAVTRDIVDTKDAAAMAKAGYTPKNLVAVLVGALSKRHDRMD